MSSAVAMEPGGCGSSDAPWIIHVNPGQRINVTLLDFSVKRTYHVNRLGDNGNTFDIETTVCREYAVIHELETEWKTMVCGGTTRRQHAYLSKSNTLKIEITNQGRRHFLLEYQGEYPLCGAGTGSRHGVRPRHGEPNFNLFRTVK